MTKQIKEILLQVVRGERPRQDLGQIGITVRTEGSQFRLENPRGITTTVELRDLARGLLAHRADTAALREWAFVVEPADLDFEVPDHPVGETIRNAVWSASFGEPVPDQVRRLVEKLIPANGSPV